MTKLNTRQSRHYPHLDIFHFLLYVMCFFQQKIFGNQIILSITPMLAVSWDLELGAWDFIRCSLFNIRYSETEIILLSSHH